MKIQLIMSNKTINAPVFNRTFFSCVCVLVLLMLQPGLVFAENAPVLAELNSGMSHEQHMQPENNAKQEHHMNHAVVSGNNMMRKSLEKSMKKLTTLPDSGVSREAGYDNTYIMASTHVNDDLNLKCAQASRGLIMLDNASWNACGGKPNGLGGVKHEKQSLSGHHH